MVDTFYFRRSFGDGKERPKGGGGFGRGEDDRGKDKFEETIGGVGEDFYECV